MELQDLKSASTYVNNLLLARGLLRHAKTIDFAEPASSPGGSGETMAKIINLVHDLVQRRNKDAEQRESLAETIRELQNGDTKQKAEIDRLEKSNAELIRGIAMSEGQERVHRNTIKELESTVKGLKDQVQRMKSSIQQVRAQCATDLRKRDVEIQRLKSHLADRQRGKRDGPTIITVKASTKGEAPAKETSGKATIKDQGYTIKEETNSFLTQLCQELSSENDAMAVTLRNAVETLKTLQGIDENLIEGQAMQEYSSSLPNEQKNLVSQHSTLRVEMNSALTQLKELLTSPSFVPLEELEARDREIFRLREGWEKMELRWKEALKMMGQHVDSTDDSPRPAMASPWKSQRPKKAGAVNGTPEQKQEATETSVSKPTLAAEKPQPKTKEKHPGKEQSETAAYGPILRPRRPKAASSSIEEKSTKTDKKSPSKTKNSPVKPSSKPQTPRVSPPKEENETVVLQRNAENKYITKRRKEHKAKKHASSKQTPVAPGQKKSTPSSSSIGRNTPAPRETSTRKRRPSTNETESKAKRQKSKITPESLDV